MKALDFILKEGELWLQYAAKINLLRENKNSLYDLKQQVLDDEKIKKYLKGISKYHSVIVSNHKNPDLPIHKLLFLLDIGFDLSVPEIQTAIDEIMAHKDMDGVYQSRVNIPTHYGGSGEDTFGWALCDAPLLLFALIKAGINYEIHIKQGVDNLLKLYRNQGFPCVVSPELGKFRGPGRKDDCCPYATLIMLKLLSKIPEYKDSEMTKELVNVQLTLWENSLVSHPYMFYMGKDFRKLKAPSMWYDIVSVVEILSWFDCAKSDKRFLEMIEIIKDKQDENGLFTPESVYQKVKEWDFGQKKKPSPYLTYLCLSILERV